MDDFGVNGILPWMCMGTSAWCVVRTMDYACNGWHFVVISPIESEIG
jgi:hypothetical protein